MCRREVGGWVRLVQDDVHQLFCSTTVGGVLQYGIEGTVGRWRSEIRWGVCFLEEVGCVGLL